MWRTRLRPVAAGSCIAVCLLVSPSPASGAAASAGVVRYADCEGDDCQAPPSAPDDPTPGTALVQGPPNPPVHFPKAEGKGKKTQKKGKHRKGKKRQKGSRR